MAYEDKTVFSGMKAGMPVCVGYFSVSFGAMAMSAIAGSLLPEFMRMALGVMLYGMFITIVVPQPKEDKSILIAVILALIFSCLFTWMPWLNQISSGLAIVICTVLAASVCALLFPVKDEEVAQ